VHLNDREETTKAAFIVSQKTARRAVDRNRIKRLMKESYRQLLPQVKKRGHWLVFLATRRATPNLKRQDFDPLVKRLCQEAKVLEEDD